MSLRAAFLKRAIFGRSAAAFCNGSWWCWSLSLQTLAQGPPEGTHTKFTCTFGQVKVSSRPDVDISGLWENSTVPAGTHLIILCSAPDLTSFLPCDFYCLHLFLSPLQPFIFIRLSVPLAADICPLSCWTHKQTMIVFVLVSFFHCTP